MGGLAAALSPSPANAIGLVAMEAAEDQGPRDWKPVHLYRRLARNSSLPASQPLPEWAMAVVTLTGCQLLWLLAVERRLAAALLTGRGVSAGPAKSTAIRELGRDSVFSVLRVLADPQHRLRLQDNLMNAADPPCKWKHAYGE